LRFLVGGNAMESLAVVEPGHAEAEEAGDRESHAQHHPAPGQTRVGLGVVVEDRADGTRDLAQGLELAEDAVETGDAGVVAGGASYG
jgi:hypothetical protein